MIEHKRYFQDCDINMASEELSRIRTHPGKVEQEVGKRRKSTHHSSTSASVYNVLYNPYSAASTSHIPSGNSKHRLSRFVKSSAYFFSQFASGKSGSTSTNVERCNLKHPFPEGSI